MGSGDKDLIRTLVLDFILAIVLVICYSPGLLNLRFSDENIIRAGFSILIIPLSAIAFYFINEGVIRHKSVKTLDGVHARVKVADADILDDIDALNEKIHDTEMLSKSYMCRSCLADIFVRANDDSTDLTVPVVRQRLQYYLTVYIETLNRMIVLEKYSRTSLYNKSYSEISNTIELLQEVFLKALDQILNNTLNGAELDNIVLKNMMAMDGYGHNPFEELKDKYK